MSKIRNYRGQRKDGKGWIEGQLLKNDGRAWIVTSIASSGITHSEAKLSDGQILLHGYYEVIPESVGQSIGIEDKTGNMIYKGDFCRRKKAIYEVVQVPGGFSFDGVNDKCNRHYYPNDFEISENWKVIGNATDTPNLLEQSHE